MNLPGPSSVAESPPSSAVPADHHEWFTREIQPHGAALVSYLKGSFRTIRDPEDVVQESFLRIWKAQAKTKITSARAFLYQIARRIAIDQIRRVERSPLDLAGSTPVDLDVLIEEDCPAQLLITKEIYTTLIQALADLPTRSREVVVLHKLRGYSHKEIAAQLNLSIRTVENRCYQGLRQCEERLRARGLSSFLG